MSTVLLEDIICEYEMRYYRKIKLTQREMNTVVRYPRKREEKEEEEKENQVTERERENSTMIFFHS